MVADDVDGSASGGGWIGLKQDMGEIIGEADANLLLVVLLGPTGDDVPRKVAAATMVCGRRLVFLVTHISVHVVLLELRLEKIMQKQRKGSSL